MTTQDPARHMTLEEVGQALGVTRERVRQIELQALAKLRIYCRLRGLQLDELLPEAIAHPEPPTDNARADAPEPAPRRHCTYCGQSFEPIQIWQQHCSTACRHADSIEQCST